MDTPYLGAATFTLRAIDVWPCLNWQTDKNGQQNPKILQHHLNIK